MDKYEEIINEELVVPCHFGLESVLKREAADLGLVVTRTRDGRVYLRGGIREAARANVGIRTGERVMLLAGECVATTFDELYEAVKAIPWEKWIPRDGRFWVRKAYSVKSALHSPRDIQSIVKKAMVDRLSSVYGISWFPETGADHPLRVSIMKDVVELAIDTSGESLHKRGYRKESVLAPLSETLASALVMLTPWKAGRILADPCCGSGTIPIEAAMIASRVAPGLTRGFLMEEWEHLKGAFAVREEKDEARSQILTENDSDIQGYDIDPKAVAAARMNAKAAGVEGKIHFQTRALADFSHAKPYGFLISNPPYGDRLQGDGGVEEIYRTFGDVYRRLSNWSMYLLTSYPDAAAQIGLGKAKDRKLYNGMIRTRYLIYEGSKPPKRKQSNERDHHHRNSQ